MPPDVCIELALWERFGWGPSDTDEMPLKRMRELFAVLEQQRVSKNAVEMGGPSQQKFDQMIAERKARDDAAMAAASRNQAPVKRTEKGVANAAADKRK